MRKGEIEIKEYYYLIKLKYPDELHGIPITGIEQSQYKNFMSIPYDAIVVLDVIKFYGCTSLDTILTFFSCNGIDTDTTIIDYIKMLFKIGLIEFVKIERVQKQNNKKWWHKLWRWN